MKKLLILLTCLCFALLSQAATITVTTRFDEDNGDANPANGSGISVREAIKYASNGDEVVVPGGNSYVIASPIEFMSDITVKGTPFSGNPYIDGNNLNRVFIISGRTVTLDGITLINGRSTLSGGALLIDDGSSVTINCCYFPVSYTHLTLPTTSRV